MLEFIFIDDLIAFVNELADVKRLALSVFQCILQCKDPSSSELLACALQRVQPRGDLALELLCEIIKLRK